MSLPDYLCHQGGIGDDDFEVDSTHLNRRVRYLTNVINHFWRRWRREYLLELRESHRTSRGRSEGSPITTGEIVLVHNEHQPRGFWKLAKVEETIAGKDGQVRGAVLRLPTKNGRATSLRRLLQLLYPLEINCQVEDVPGASDNMIGANNGEPEEEVPTPGITLRRSKRLAASQANDQLKACLLELKD